MTEHFEVTLLGTASARPMPNRHPAGQFVTVCGKCFLVDCGEGTQMQIRRYGLKLHRLNHIFISHLHGDHCFGLIGLISTIGLSKRTADLTIYAHADLEKVLRLQLDYFCSELSFKVHLVTISTFVSEVIYEDRSVKVTTIPLHHRMPCCGFLFERKASDRHLIAEKLAFFNVPIASRQAIKGGADFVTEEGRVIANQLLTREGTPAFRYAYCSDTAYSEKVVEMVQGCDLLYHETTFLQEDALRAKQTYHSTARQAATVACKAGVGALLMGHYSSRMDDLIPLWEEAREVFERSYLGYDGLRVSEKELSFDGYALPSVKEASPAMESIFTD